MSKLRLYISTAMHLKPSQVVYRVWRRIGGKTPLRFGYNPKPDVGKADIGAIPVLPELDFDPVLLSRFDVDAILDDRIELLHHEEQVDWRESWHAELSTPLWRFNLHYHEYLLPLAKAYLDTGDVRYLDKGKAIVESWIRSCPRSVGGVAWDPYVISMRVVNWLAFYGELREKIDHDPIFVSALNCSLAQQYMHLSQHLEKDLLANHYLENLKALVILAHYFNDTQTFDAALPVLAGQVCEQILPDGMHFELSPLYHKVVLEDLLRVAVTLQAQGMEEAETVALLRLQKMCDCLFSLERGASRTPLFNDSGDNVAKSCHALLSCAKKRFGIAPTCRVDLPDAGYYLIERDTAAGHVKVVFDAGAPGPECALGHAHCDALSMEVFVDGLPAVVNRGTYAYQDERRLDLKRTAAHSTVQADGIEQSECWAPFRMARSARCWGKRLGEFEVRGCMVDWAGNRIERTVWLGEDGRLAVVDAADPSVRLVSRFHLLGVSAEGPELCESCYCPEFGKALRSTCAEGYGAGSIAAVIDLASRDISWDCDR
ncbi:MAG TPA: heparinase II/III family protein [Candidatus Rubneribacter avistercoris]|nr:heparinase II/III family protein [Candidatus Rubneribacter avistercoris]